MGKRETFLVGGTSLFCCIGRLGQPYSLLQGEGGSCPARFLKNDRVQIEEFDLGKVCWSCTTPATSGPGPSTTPISSGFCQRSQGLPDLKKERRTSQQVRLSFGSVRTDCPIWRCGSVCLTVAPDHFGATTRSVERGAPAVDVHADHGQRVAGA